MNSHAPPNGKGASSNAPIRNFNLPHFYQRCSHSAKKIERMPPGHIHFAAEQCADCGRLLRWLPRPGTIQRRRLNAFRLARLLMCDKLNSWERGFVRDLSQRRKLSPKQQEIIDRLCAQYLEGKP